MKCIFLETSNFLQKNRTVYDNRYGSLTIKLVKTIFIIGNSIRFLSLVLL